MMMDKGVYQLNHLVTVGGEIAGKCNRLMWLDSDCRKLIGEIHSATNWYRKFKITLQIYDVS